MFVFAVCIVDLIQCCSARIGTHTQAYTHAARVLFKTEWETYTTRPCVNLFIYLYWCIEAIIAMFALEIYCMRAPLPSDRFLLDSRM